MSNIDELLRSFGTIPRESTEGSTGMPGKEAVADNKKSSTANILLKSFENIPRQEKSSREDAAIADMKELVEYLEKTVKGTVQETDKQKIRQKKEEYQKSIKILADMLLKG